jgi:hypothetical protein
MKKHVNVIAVLVFLVALAAFAAALKAGGGPTPISGFFGGG